MQMGYFVCLFGVQGDVRLSDDEAGITVYHSQTMKEIHFGLQKLARVYNAGLPQLHLHS